MSRRADVHRQTAETTIDVSLDLDGTGEATLDTGVPFYDHMLHQIARHGLFDLKVDAKGDLEVDAHHTVEDVAIALGQAFDQALGERAGIVRFGAATVPLDEALAEVVVDLGGRPFLAFDAPTITGRRSVVLGGLPVDLVDHVFQSFSVAARATVHVELRRGENLHHCVESVFKAFARALRQATAIDPRAGGVPSTKGTLSA